MRVTRLTTNKFKNNEIAVFLEVPLKRETITKNAILPAVLRRGSANYTSQLEIGKALENMYGASFNAGVEKTGESLILKFYIESLCDEYIKEKANLAEESIKLLFDIIFNPYVQNNSFSEEYVSQEKKNLADIINSRSDDKRVYAVNRCIEEMFKGEPYGLYKYGYAEDLKDITASSLYEYYLKMLKECKMYVIINGKEAENITIPQTPYDIEELKTIVDTSKKENKNQKKVEQNNDNQSEEKVITEELDVTQGKLMIGLDVASENKFATSMYNVVLGGSANSKLFQNVREKASLAYSASSSYIRRKNAIIIKTGIELKNYEKTLSIIKAQLQDMQDGKITDDEVKSAKQLAVSSLKMIPESQDETITFSLDQDMYGENLTVEEYIKKVEAVTKEQIIDVANNVKINTIYYLKDKEKENK